ncbi:MAG TPA: TonB-dependent receptor, partial [Chitinophagaceae bacterium]|nr:TonB-dependent receptor [Chitinophagaceae bacterium]
YFLSVSYRADGNSRFSDNVRWGNFGSIGLGWRIDKESFMQSISWINQLKLRGSYGSVGNDNGIGLYPFRALYDFANNSAEPGFLQSSVENPELTWEKNTQFDLGVDFALFSNRLSGSIEYFNRQSDNLLFQVPLPLSTGISYIWQNVGTMYNRGVELQVSVDAVRQKDFNWNINFNWTTLKNEITKLPDGQDEIISGTKKLMVGHSIYDYWLRGWYGVDPADGAGLYLAETNDPSNSRVSEKGDIVTTAVNNGKYHYAGSAIPDFYGGITNSFRYKAVELSILLNYQVGGKIYDQTYATLMHDGTYGNALSVDVLNRWQSPGQKTNVPRMDNAKVGQWDAQSDRWLTSASFLNIRAVNLMYNLPAKFIAKANAQSARVYLSAENLWLFSA